MKNNVTACLETVPQKSFKQHKIKQGRKVVIFEVKEITNNETWMKTQQYILTLSDLTVSIDNSYFWLGTYILKLYK